MTRRRTKKTFTNYNDYHDRPFGLKWGTAFALSELTKTINEGQTHATKEVIELPQMTREEMDSVLQHAFTKSCRISIQVNIRDGNNRLIDTITGSFTGYSDYMYLYVGNNIVSWDVIRHITILSDPVKD
ncbi:hypothetical protein GTU75_01285 [Erysipelothrix rhusiopathiae]|nr:hypothetical protein [Erysipelothrix sp. strain 2 (EsS2-6-Brazil)]MBK2403253.1 hypothetical protein [Erysipelothrix sp. strain 2 (EsS2-7-Brazil)]NBA00780.1 hypothetical protein [Erysipelothrix rhusiopathiae]